VIELVIWFRSQGTSWPLRAGDIVEVREAETRLEIRAELVIEIVAHHFRSIELQEAMRTGALPRKPPARALPDVIAQRRLARRSRRRA
jgi:hypothetical protein